MVMNGVKKGVGIRHQQKYRYYGDISLHSRGVKAMEEAEEEKDSIKGR
jgi:hypothetical protein